ncbi:hypothetical protein HYZ80_04165 [Candidatus Parcubacteria bacterium]|nr:hypothetical protein [Candidatus Parcubacteria bacterium]
MNDDVKNAADRIMLWYHGLALHNRRAVDPNGSIAHLIERRRELTSRLASVDRELTTIIAERLASVPPDLQLPVEYALRALNAALESLIARGEIHGAETDCLAELIDKAYQYAINVVGYPATFADGILNRVLKQLARARAEQHTIDYAREDERYRARGNPAAATRRRRK